MCIKALKSQVFTYFLSQGAIISAGMESGITKSAVLEHFKAGELEVALMQIDESKVRWEKSDRILDYKTVWDCVIEADDKDRY